MKTILNKTNIIEGMAKSCRKFLADYKKGEVILKSCGREILYRRENNKWVMIDP